MLCLSALAALSACEDDKDDKDAVGTKDSPSESAGRYVLGSVVIDAEGNRTTYVQTVGSLEDGPFTNEKALELPGNGVIMAHGSYLFVGLTEEPTWVRYTIAENGDFEESERLSFLNLGATSIDYGNVIVDDETAVSVFSNPPVAVVWNPETMEIRGEVALDYLLRDGYELEVWTTIAHDGRVYIPGRWSDWEGARIFPNVATTILDPKKLEIIGVAEDDRCASGGRVVFDKDGYGYVMGDGRTYSIQMFANAAGTPAPDNCLLRIAPGETDFEADYFHKIPDLTGGRQTIGELETATQGTGIGFSKVFYEDMLPEGVEPIDFAFWEERAHKLWRIRLGDEPTAEEVEGAPFAAIGFTGSSLEGHLYTGESPDGEQSEVYETDPDENRAVLRFTMDGYFNGLYAVR